MCLTLVLAGGIHVNAPSRGTCNVLAARSSKQELPVALLYCKLTTIRLNRSPSKNRLAEVKHATVLAAAHNAVSRLANHKQLHLCLSQSGVQPMLQSMSAHKAFTYRDLHLASGGFSNHNVVGEGGFGSVYKGQLRDGALVALKRLDRCGLQVSSGSCFTRVGSTVAMHCGCILSTVPGTLQQLLRISSHSVSPLVTCISKVEVVKLSLSVDA